VSLFRAIILGALQGATEFLPVSSSGHLVLVPWLLGWDSSGLVFDAVVHWGTALAIVVYFWSDWLTLMGSFLGSLRELGWRKLRVALGGVDDGWENVESPSWATLAWFVVLGTMPAALIGYLLEDFFESMFGRPVFVAGFLLITAVLLIVTEYSGRRERDLEAMNWLDALLVGLGQTLAIFPGISRSGSTIAAGLARGLKRESAARFSFFLATPIIIGAGLFKTVDLAQKGGLVAQAPALIVGFVTAAAVGLACIHFLLQYLQRRRLYPFAAYCAIFGFINLLVALWRV
jgi:undecaprenyl-diphosphatase